MNASGRAHLDAIESIPLGDTRRTVAKLRPQVIAWFLAMVPISIAYRTKSLFRHVKRNTDVDGLGREASNQALLVNAVATALSTRNVSLRKSAQLDATSGVGLTYSPQPRISSRPPYFPALEYSGRRSIGRRSEDRVAHPPSSEPRLT